MTGYRVSERCAYGTHDVLSVVFPVQSVFSARLHAGRLPRHLGVVRWVGQIRGPLLGVQLQQRLEGVSDVVDLRMQVTELGEARRHRVHVEESRVDTWTLPPCDRRRNRGAW